MPRHDRPVWRNEWRPAVLVERNNRRFSRHLAPDMPPPPPATGGGPLRAARGLGHAMEPAVAAGG